MLKGEGYEVRKVQMEDGNFEAYVIKAGKKFEVVLNADLKITDTKAAD
jgi:Peptidase propeptide and YPEB domain